MIKSARGFQTRRKNTTPTKRSLRAEALRGFTLVELLVVIAIIAILAAVVVLIINPLELTRRSRDAARFTDLANLQQAINVSVQEATNSGTAILCASSGAYPCNGSSVGGGRTPDGNGWVKANLQAQTSVSVPTLPVDPINSAGATGFHYSYCADQDAWEINTRLESEQQRPKMAQDGGDENDPSNNYINAKYEVGSNLTLFNTSAGCTY